MKTFLTLIVGVILGVGILGGVIYLRSYKTTVAPSKPQTVSSVENTPSVTIIETNLPTETVLSTGIIEGSLSYPSSGIPQNMMVCAETIQGIKVSCTSEHLQDNKYQYGEGYRLETSPGNYFVYAIIPGQDTKAYYNEFVTCGLKYECKSHKKIEVVVKAGLTTEKIDPQDWYNQ